MDIPKKIHYCWFGYGKKSDLILKCIDSWKKYMPEYEIIEWNEQNFTIDNEYAQEALSIKKYAFVSDYVRLKVIYDHGGIYLDTDVELIQSLKPLLKKGGFIGFERTNTVTTGLGFAAPAKSKIVEALLAEYNGAHFITKEGLDQTACPIRNTRVLKQFGLKTDNTQQVIGDMVVYPNDYFCPIDYDSGVLKLTENTHSIHHYGYSWADKESKKILEWKRKIFKYFPRWCAQFVFNVFNHFYRKKLKHD